MPAYSPSWLDGHILLAYGMATMRAIAVHMRTFSSIAVAALIALAIASSSATLPAMWSSCGGAGREDCLHMIISFCLVPCLGYGHWSCECGLPAGIGSGFVGGSGVESTGGMDWRGGSQVSSKAPTPGRCCRPGSRCED